MIRYMTAGESHGEALVTIVDGLPAGLRVDRKILDRELARRMAGYGRGGRMKIERDTAHVLSGIRSGRTIGSPVAIMIKNRDFRIDSLPPIAKARPGHADLAGALKYDTRDIRDILERASARETACRVAAGALAKIFLAEFGIDMLSHVISIGPVVARTGGLGFARIRSLAEKSCLRCADPKAERMMKAVIDNAKREGDSLGGCAEVVVKGAPPGLGSHVQWDRRLDGNIARALMSIPAVKSVEIGGGFRLTLVPGSRAHDEIFYAKGRFGHRTNNAGGIEGGMTNGEDIVLRVGMKPIATLMRPLSSVNIRTGKKALAQVERADVVAVPACGVVAEAAAALEVANAFSEKFGGDSVGETAANFKACARRIKNF